MPTTYCLLLHDRGSAVQVFAVSEHACPSATVRSVCLAGSHHRHTFCAVAGAASVIACEWNPNALQALQRNLELNGVADRCHVLEGDCRLTAPKVVFWGTNKGLKQKKLVVLGFKKKGGKYGQGREGIYLGSLLEAALGHINNQHTQ